MVPGTGLSADEWRDNVRLRYNHSPLEMPAACDGCGAKMSVEHALSCKTGGLVHIRHDDVADEWRHLCGTALSPCRVEREPRIFSSVSRQVRNAAGASAPDSRKVFEARGLLFVATQQTKNYKRQTENRGWDWNQWLNN